MRIGFGIMSGLGGAYGLIGMEHKGQMKWRLRAYIKGLYWEPQTGNLKNIVGI